MRAANIVEILTPKRYVLNGLWLGPKKSKRVFIWVHGLGSSMFSKLAIAEKLVDRDSAVLMFNNRGHDKVASIKRTDGTYLKAGAAHEVFTESVDDIQGAVNFAKRNGAKDVYLIGHSTGCQKSVYWAYKTKGKGVKGIILLAPVSDYEAERKLQGVAKIARATKVVRALITRGKKHELLPPGLWHEDLDAQRFLSLYTPDSIEEIFSYGQFTKVPRILRSVRIPLLAFWAENDEFGLSIGRKVSDWFNLHMENGDFLIVPKVKHSFSGAEKEIAETVREWVKAV